jgi:sporulation protein YqfC
MSFVNNALLKLGIDPQNLVGGNKISMFDGKAVFIEGHNGIFSYEPEQIIVKLKKENLAVEGKGLKIIEINKDELYIVGTIVKIERLI